MTSSDTTTPTAGLSEPAAAGNNSGWLWAAFVVAVLALTGSLFLSLGLGLKACPLCFYQRTFAMSLVAVLGMGLVTGVGGSGRLGLLALPLAAAGLGVALFHVSLELRGKLECPPGLLGLGSAPQQSLAMFVLLFAVLLIEVLRQPQARVGHRAITAGGIVLGALLAVGSCISNPPMPSAPKEPYTKAPDVCRPPYRPTTEP